MANTNVAPATSRRGNRMRVVKGFLGSPSLKFFYLLPAVRWGSAILTSQETRDNNQCDCFVIKHQTTERSEPNGFSIKCAQRGIRAKIAASFRVRTQCVVTLTIHCE